MIDFKATYDQIKPMVKQKYIADRLSVSEFTISGWYHSHHQMPKTKESNLKEIMTMFNKEVIYKK